MERKTIERTNQGQYAKYPEGIDKFAEKVAKELCEKYPTVDFFDLQNIFEREFSFAMSTELLKYICERSNKDNNEG